MTKIPNRTYIVYDKGVDDYHSFSNEYTINITPEYLQVKKIPYQEGKKALDSFNKKVDKNYQITEKLNFNVYDFYFYEFSDKELTGITDKIIVGIIVIDNKAFAKKFNKKGKVPNEDFIKTALRFHKQYELEYKRHIAQNSGSEKPKTQMIADIALEPKNKIQIRAKKQPSCINKKFKLKPHQKKNLKWWTEAEKHPKKCYFSSGYEFEIQIGEIFYDPRLCVFKNIKDRDHVTFPGGMIIDVVGTGKTLSAIISSVKNPIKKLKYIRKGRINSGATLIISPPQVAKQWAREIKRFINPKKIELNVVMMLGKTDLDKRSYQDLLDADFVITSHTFWNNPSFLGTWLPKKFKKSYLKSTEYDFNVVDKIFDKCRNDLVKHPKKLENTSPIIPIIDWWRIIIDEFHEPYTEPQLSYLKHIIPHLHGKCRWGLSGTPFNKGNCINEMVSFVTGYKTRITSNIYNVDEVYNHMITNFFSRHVNEEKEGLKELTEKVIWLKFSKSESMIYTAFIANPNIDKYGIEARQLCCHPQLVNELKGKAFDNCKTISDMEGVMVKHYKNQYDAAKEKIKNKEKQIDNYESYLIGLTYRQQKRFLTQLGYKVTVEYPDWYDGYGADASEEEEEEDESDDEDDERQPITVSEDNQKEVIRLVKQLWHNRASGIDQTKESIEKAKQDLVFLEKDMKGKKVSYNFFKNMIEKIKQAQEDKMDMSESDYDSELDEEDGDPCSICHQIIDPDNVGMAICGHTFHYDCIKKTVIKNGRCPLCTKKLKATQIFIISHEKEEPMVNGVITGKMGLVNMVGTKLANMICYLMSIEDSVIIFSQWDDLLHKVGDILNQFGIPNRFCRGNVHMRDKAIRDFMDSKNIRAIMLSSKSAASGANITKATKILFLDLIFGTPEYITNTEWQAIGRAYRMGQENDVEIVRFITKGTVEEEIHKKNLEQRKKAASLVIAETTDDTISLSAENLEKINEYVKKYQKTLEDKKKSKEKKKKDDDDGEDEVVEVVENDV